MITRRIHSSTAGCFDFDGFNAIIGLFFYLLTLQIAMGTDFLELISAQQRKTPQITAYLSTFHRS